MSQNHQPQLMTSHHQQHHHHGSYHNSLDQSSIHPSQSRNVSNKYLIIKIYLGFKEDEWSEHAKQGWR